MPPVHSGATKYCAWRISAVEYMTTEDPLGAKPNLCVSVEMDVTPGTRKSNGGSLRPSDSAKAMRKEPRQQSTCCAKVG